MQGEVQEPADGEDAAAAAAASEQGFEDQPMTVVACGANDKTYTVWGTETPLPLIHMSQVNGESVDLVTNLMRHEVLSADGCVSAQGGANPPSSCATWIAAGTCVTAEFAAVCCWVWV
eukprot:GHUV01028162.1.p3 GENE.GHUV01028162.1~~GHUV01028162.1.p3  ORF type:complete len:118 (-),score=29.74 GHUV01028162.1:48-401(-)